MKKLNWILVFNFCVFVTGTSFAHGFQEFSHNIQPKVQSQIIDVLEELLKRIPAPKENLDIKSDVESLSFTNSLFNRLDFGNTKSLTELQNIIAGSPLAELFAPIESTVYLEELMTLIDEYSLHTEQSHASNVQEEVAARIRKIEISLEQGGK